MGRVGFTLRSLRPAPRVTSDSMTHRLPPNLPRRGTGTKWNKLAYSWRTRLVDTLLSRSRTYGPHFQDSLRLPVNPGGGACSCTLCRLQRLALIF